MPELVKVLVLKSSLSGGRSAMRGCFTADLKFPQSIQLPSISLKVLRKPRKQTCWMVCPHIPHPCVNSQAALGLHQHRFHDGMG